MKPSSYFGPQLARIPREQRAAGRAAWLAERRAVGYLGGRGMTAGRKIGFGSSVRASTSFGLRGGELCGCRGAACGSCHSVGEAAPPWEHLGWRLKAGMAMAPAMRCTAGKAGGASGGVTPPPAKLPIPDYPYPTFPGGVFGPDDLFGIGWRDPSAGEYIDVHAHDFCSSEGDWTGTREDTDYRLGLLYGLRSAGIDRMVISGFADDKRLTGDDGTPILDDQRIDEVTEYASDRYYDYFIPFVRVFEFDDPDAPDYVESFLAAGFAGVGELILHGHGFDFNEPTDVLIDVCRVAVKYDVPVLVHCDMGNVDDPTVRGAGENFSQLMEVLSAFPAEDPEVVSTGVFDTNTSIANNSESKPLKLILAHCGVGPNDVMEAGPLFAWTERIDFLLMNYPQVSFDLSGMQLDQVFDSPSCHQLFDPSSGTLTAIGKALLERILRWPTRFMFGTDMESRAGYYATAYSRSVPLYDEFLDKGAASAGEIPEAIQHMVKGTNALNVLASSYSEAVETESTLPTPDVSIPTPDVGL